MDFILRWGPEVMLFGTQSWIPCHRALCFIASVQFTGFSTIHDIMKPQQISPMIGIQPGDFIHPNLNLDQLKIIWESYITTQEYQPTTILQD